MPGARCELTSHKLNPFLLALCTCAARNPLVVSLDSETPLSSSVRYCLFSTLDVAFVILGHFMKLFDF